jgi:hypothetical protein
MTTATLTLEKIEVDGTCHFSDRDNTIVLKIHSSRIATKEWIPSLLTITVQLP